MPVAILRLRYLPSASVCALGISAPVISISAFNIGSFVAALAITPVMHPSPSVVLLCL